MIAPWMVYALMIGVLLSAAAAALERVVLSLRRPMRFIWAASMVASLCAPPLAALWKLYLARDVAPPAAAMRPFAIGVQRVTAIAAGPEGSNRAAATDVALIGAWALASGFLLLRLMRAVVALRRRRAGWRRETVDGVDVHLSPDVGPAVIGVRSMTVVLPEWILSLDAPLRAMVLRHEEEHRAARDPYLLLAATVAVALMPWNLALWWQARRLRLAVEMDCDARVLRADPRLERYGMLLLTIAQRRSFGPGLLAQMLSEPTTQLERRIMTMRATAGQGARLTIVGAGAAAILVLGLACSLQSPDIGTSPQASRPAPSRVNANQTFFEFQVEQPARPRPGNGTPRYPDSLRVARVEGGVLAQFVVDTTGYADMSTFKVLKSDNDLFTQTVRSALPNMAFYPAEVGHRKVKQLIQMPFQFNLSKSTSERVPAAAGDSARQPSNANRVRVLAPVRVMAAPAPSSDSQAQRSRTPPPEFKEFRIERPAQPMAQNPAPRYPDALRAANIEGDVLAQFVVDTTGRVEATTFKVLKSTRPEFVDAVKDVLPELRFTPAEVGGRHVKQLVQMPFSFSPSK